MVLSISTGTFFIRISEKLAEIMKDRECIFNLFDFLSDVAYLIF